MGATATLQVLEMTGVTVHSATRSARAFMQKPIADHRNFYTEKWTKDEACARLAAYSSPRTVR
jgi:hypothetical protein